MKKGSGYSNIPLKRIMRGSFFTLLILVIIMMFSAMLSLYHVSERTVALYNQPFLRSSMIFQIKENIKNIQKDLYVITGADDSEEITTAVSDIEESQGVISEDVKILESLKTESNESLIEQCSQILEESNAVFANLKTLIDSKDIQQYEQLINEQYIVLLKNSEEVLEALADESIEEAADFVTAANVYTRNSIIFNIVFMVICVFTASWIAKKLTEVLIAPINEVNEAMKQMEQGNLNIELNFKGSNEFGVMAERVRNMSVTLEKYVSETSYVLSELAQKNMTITIEKDFKGSFMPISQAVKRIVEFMNETLTISRQAAQNVDSGSEQVAVLTTSLSDTASEQSASIEELVSSIEEVTINVEENAKSAQHVNDISYASMKKIEEGNIYMNSLLDSMEAIAKQSEEISGIMRIIDSISSQTNLLSLNASIEAARAGEAGRGFAVVAGEIGTLAKDCAEAAKNTAELINKNIEVTQKGSELAKETAGVLEDVVKSVEETGILVENITTACEEQASALENINEGVDVISESVQNLTAMSEESSAASEELLTQSTNLKDMLSSFNLTK